MTLRSIYSYQEEASVGSPALGRMHNFEENNFEAIPLLFEVRVVRKGRWKQVLKSLPSAKFTTEITEFST